MRDLRKLGSAVFAALALAAGSASAHMLFVVPEKGADKAKVILSENLDSDQSVDLIAKTTLDVRTASDGRDTKVLLSSKKDAAFNIVLPGEGTRIVHGDLLFGVEDRGPKPFLLSYHPKTIVGDPFDAKTKLGEKTALAEIIPTGKPGAVVFQVLFAGKPVADAKVTVCLPDGSEKEVKADAEGRTAAFAETGRIGVWARCVEPGAGEMDGKQYVEKRHYPTLVLDIAGPDTSKAQPAAATVKPAEQGRPAISAAPTLVNVVPSAYPNMPEKVSSFGASLADGYVYVYGGHTAPTHHYDVDAVSGKFHRLKLDGGKTWEPLESGTALQGMNIVSHGGKIYRVGGMQPRNKVGDKEDNYSIADVVVFDPATQKWSNLAPLPEPRSSHDIVAFGDKLLVLGGWNMKGAAAGNEWPKNALMLDLSSSTPEWKSIPQPFQRRALIAAVHDNKVFVIGGFDEHDDPTLEVNIFDPAKNEWTKGPDLPGKSRYGFAPAACTLDGKLYVSVMDGSMYRLDDAGKKWDTVAKTTPRIVHRLIPHNGQILVLGGADRGGNFDLVEVVKPELIPVAQGRAE